ncbi:uncharacterized protein [Spinacia oleracea]|uniref:Aminotransferase-like plant mobile domain-containing protein n=1 Tax=Spinacia oleracea TaxID=3562 RepID=A0ABM3R0Z0_SPIOL|nr:uncharacterized protein LOC130464003 [Spinacia oleracea]
MFFVIFAICSMSGDTSSSSTEGEASDCMMQPRVVSSRPMRWESTYRAVRASQRARNDSSSPPLESRGGLHPEDEPPWLGPIEYYGIDLHHDLGHHVVSRFRAGRAELDTSCRPYGWVCLCGAFGEAGRINSRVGGGMPLLSERVLFREVVGSNASRRFLRLFLEWWWDTTKTFHFPWGEITITPEDYTALTGLSFTGTSIHNIRDAYIPSQKTVRECIGEELAVEVAKYGGKGMPYSLMVDVLAKVRPSGASARAMLVSLPTILEFDNFVEPFRAGGSLADSIGGGAIRDGFVFLGRGSQCEPD